MSSLEVGDVLDPRTEAKVEWAIPNYFSLTQKTDTVYESPSFSFLDKTWNLRLFPNGQRSNDTVGFVNVYLELQDKTSVDLVANVTFAIKCSRKMLKTIPFDFRFNDQSSILGCTKLCTRLDLHRSQSYYLRGGTLTVICDAKTSFSKSTASQTHQDSTALFCRDFHDLLKSERKSDLNIQVQDRTFRVHKLILGTRSPVFSAMFEHNMAERNSNRVDVIDCDPDTFQQFLEYMYTGDLGNITRNNVVGLFAVSDKYCVVELKDRCVEFMTEDLCVDTVCEVIVAADRHNESELKHSAEILLVENIKTILPTEQWKKLLVENYSLGVELLMKVIPGDTGPSKMVKAKSMSVLPS